MDFGETLLAAQRNQQEKKSNNAYYKARFDPPKKEQKQKDRLSANIQKFLAKKEEEEKQKQLELKRKRDELLAMRDPKAIRKIQKTLKVIKSANKSVIQDAIDYENTAVTLEGPQQPDEDDYGYESQESAAIYQKMMAKYSKMPEKPKFPDSGARVKMRDLEGTKERVKYALQHVGDPVPHKRRRRSKSEQGIETESSPPPEPQDVERKSNKSEKPDKPKFRKPLPPPMDFNSLLKLAEKKKSEPLDIPVKKEVEGEGERPMTKRQKKEFEEEQARRFRRQQIIELEQRERKVPMREHRENTEQKQKEIKKDPRMNRIPKLSDKYSDGGSTSSMNSTRYDGSTSDKERFRLDKEDRARQNMNHVKMYKDLKEEDRLSKLKEKSVTRTTGHDREKQRHIEDKVIREREDRVKSSHSRDQVRPNMINKHLAKSFDKLPQNTTSESRKPVNKIERGKTKLTIEDNVVRDITTKNIDIKGHNTYRIDKNYNDKRLLPAKVSARHNLEEKILPKSTNIDARVQVKERAILAKQKMLFGSDRDGRKTSEISKTENEINQRLSQKKTPYEGQRKIEKHVLVDNSKTATSSKAKITNTFDFDKHVSSLGNTSSQKLMSKGDNKQQDSARQFPPGSVKRKLHPDAMQKKPQYKRPVLKSESEYDSDMDDFIDDDGDDMDVSQHIKNIFGYDRSKYRGMDDDDPNMESSFTRQMREEYISKKMGILEDLEDMRQEALEKKKSKKLLKND